MACAAKRSMLKLPIRLTVTARLKTASAWAPFLPTVFSAGAMPAPFTQPLSLPIATPPATTPSPRPGARRVPMNPLPLMCMFRLQSVGVDYVVAPRFCCGRARKNPPPTGAPPSRKNHAVEHLLPPGPVRAHDADGDGFALERLVAGHGPERRVVQDHALGGGPLVIAVG